jgi:hypothetical protein
LPGGDKDRLSALQVDKLSAVCANPQPLPLFVRAAGEAPGGAIFFFEIMRDLSM